MGGDGCSASCTQETGYFCPYGGGECETVCGDNTVAGTEVCDGDVDGQYCADDCTGFVGSCGDGIVQMEIGEECDITDPPLTILDEPMLGMGGADSSSSYVSEGSIGCTECRATPGFLCDAGSNACQQTGVPRYELGQYYPGAICALLVGLSGGEGNTFRCDIGGQPYDITPYSVEQCTENLGDLVNDTCTIGQFEDWALGKTRCQLYTVPTPCD